MSRAVEVEIPKSCHAILSGNMMGTMSTLRKKDGLISTNPVGYVWDGQRIRVSTLKSHVKYQNLLANPTITFCVISRENITQYIEIRGNATIEDDSDRSFFRRQYLEGTGGQEPPDDLDPPDAERVVITIHPEQVSSPTIHGGRFDKK